jgi:hypothetical protein
MGSYEQWDALIRQCVCWVKAEGLSQFSVEDPADAVSQNYENDPETQKLRSILMGWYTVHGSTQIRVGEVLRLAEEHGIKGGCTWEPDEDQAELLEALREIAGEPEKVNTRRLGRWIERQEGRVLDGMKLERGKQQRGSASWMVRLV